MRWNVPILGSIKVVDTTGMRRGIALMNTSSQDIFWSEDQRLLDSVTGANLPTVGMLLPAVAAGVTPLVVVLPFHSNGKIFVRAQNTGAQIEVLIYECDCPQSAQMAVAA